MPHILQLRGPRAASEFRLAKLVAALQKIDPAVRAVDAEFWHFVECERAPDAKERALLERLLAYGAPASPAKGERYLVVPRLGTISPWSSKATDIAHNCGLAVVKRLERGTAWTVDSTRPGIAALLHDRMTETVLSSLDDAARLFQHVPPRPLGTIPISGLREANAGLGLALSDDEIEYLERAYRALGGGELALGFDEMPELGAHGAEGRVDGLERGYQLGEAELRSRARPAELENLCH